MLSKAIFIVFLISLVSITISTPLDKLNNLSKRNTIVHENRNSKLNALKRIFKRDCYSDGFGYCDCGCCGDQYDGADCYECASCCGC